MLTYWRSTTDTDIMSMGLIGAEEEYAQQYDSVTGRPYTPAGVLIGIQYHPEITFADTNREEPQSAREDKRCALWTEGACSMISVIERKLR